MHLSRDGTQSVAGGRLGSQPEVDYDSSYAYVGWIEDNALGINSIWVNLFLSISLLVLFGVGVFVPIGCLLDLSSLFYDCCFSFT